MKRLLMPLAGVFGKSSWKKPCSRLLRWAENLNDFVSLEQFSSLLLMDEVLMKELLESG